MIAANEARFNATSWDVEVTLWKFLRGDAIDSAERDGLTRISGRVLLEADTGRYRVAIDKTTSWINGSDPYTSETLEASFDGAKSHAWRRAQPGTSIPDQRITADGTISRDDSAVFDQKGLMAGWPAHSLGIGHVPPLFSGYLDPVPVRLSSFLRSQLEQRHPVRLEELADQWRLHTRWRSASGETDWIHIDYHPGKGAIVGVSWGGTESSLDPCWRRLELDLIQVDGRIWVPREARAVRVSDKPPTMERFVYSNFRVNPEIKVDTFAVSFPIGTRVNDSVAETKYVVGLEPVHQAAAARSFLEAKESSLADPPQKRGISPWLVWTTVALGLVLGWRLFRSWRSSKANTNRGSRTLPMFIGVTYCAGGFAAVAADAPTIPALNRGHVTALAALHFPGVSHDADKVYRSLPVDDEGLSANALRDVLEAH